MKTLLLALFALCGTLAAQSPIVRYDFDEASGTTIIDRSGLEPYADLTIEGTHAWSDGALVVDGTTRVLSGPQAAKIAGAVRSTNEFSILAWISTDDLTQDGPARIATMSQGSGARNFTIGHGGYGAIPDTAYTFRVRTDRNEDGRPEIETPAGAVTGEIQMVALTCDPSGAVRVYLDGIVVVEDQLSGDFSTWDPEFRLVLGNEDQADRGWSGSLHHFEVYDRALPQDVIIGELKRRDIGTVADPVDPPADPPADPVDPPSDPVDPPSDPGTGNPANDIDGDGVWGPAVFATDYPRSPSDVGVPAGTTLTPSSGMTITVDGTVLEDLDITGTVVVRANHVTIRRCRIDGGTYAIDCRDGYQFPGMQARNTVIEDCELYSVGSAHIAGSDWICRRSYLHTSGGDAFKPFQRCLMEACYIERLGSEEGAHADGAQWVSGSDGWVYFCNFELPSRGWYNPQTETTLGIEAAGGRSNSPLLVVANTGDLTRIRIVGNRLNGGNTTLDLEQKSGNTLSDVLVQGNVFGFQTNSFGSTSPTAYLSRLRGGSGISATTFLGNRLWDGTLLNW